MIDSHHHFWHYNTDDYGWIGDDMAALRRDFLPADLKSEIEAAGVSGVVSVQARQNLEETRWLLELANQNDWILGVVGWVPLISPQIEAYLEEFSVQKKLKAARHVLQGEADDDYMLRTDFNTGIAALKRFQLVYDVLIFERHLPQTIEFVDRHPNQIFVLDHIAKPLIKDGLLEPWKTQIGELAKRENVYCKLSGMVTEADLDNWSSEDLKPYFDTVLEAFGPSRLMFGSDWPVCLAACSYTSWANTVKEWASSLSAYEKDDLFQATSRRVYLLV